MKYFDVKYRRERYFDKNGDEIHAGDYIRMYPMDEPKLVYEFEDINGDFGLGTDATNPYWIETGKATACEYGIYPLNWDDTENCELCGRS